MATTTQTSTTELCSIPVPVPVHPSRSFYFPDGDTIISCRDRSYRVHSRLLALYSVVMRKALTTGQLPRIWGRLEDTSPRGAGNITRRTCSYVVESQGTGVAKQVRDIFYFISLDDSVKTIELLFYCIYSCRNKPRITIENFPELLHISISYSIPTLLPLCINFLKSLSLFRPLTAITTIRHLIRQNSTSEIVDILNTLYSEALTTILNDFPRYQEEHQKEEYTRVIPAEIRYAFSECWTSYVERVESLRSEEVLFGGFTYPHLCRAEQACEEETRTNLQDAWCDLWKSCTRNVPRPCEISRFFMTADQRVGCGEKNGLCGEQIKQELGKILRGLGGEDAAWDWKFLAIEERNFKAAKDMAIERARVDL